MAPEHVNLTLGTAGHVDHGKTALVKMLTGCDTDRLKAEKKRGLTIELGFAPCRMADERIVGVVDVPGHVDFIRNMVAGAHGVDVVIFVIAADDGVMPQTREHLDILTLMGCRHGLVALTKIDLVDDELRGLVEEEVREFLKGAFLESAPILPVSNVTFEGYEAFFAALNQVVGQVRPHPQAGVFRVWVERVFSVKGFGTVVSGIPSSGEVRPGDRLRVVPGEASARVRRLQVYGEDADLGREGECVALNLADLAADAVERGRVLAAGDTVGPVRMFEAELRLLAHLPGPMPDYTEVHLHVGTAETMADVAILDAASVAPGETRLVQLRLREPLGVVAGDRFVLRAAMPGLAGGRVTTVGGGRILDTSNLRLRRRRPWTLEALAARREALGSPRAWCAALLAEAGRARTPEVLAREARMPLLEVAPILEALAEEGVVREVGGGAYVHRETIADAAVALQAALEDFHTAYPTRVGAEVGALGSAVPEGALAPALEALEAAGTLARHGSLVALAGRGAWLSETDRALCERLLEAYRIAHLAPPSPEEAAAEIGAPAADVERLVRLLVDEGELVRVDAALVMHAEAVERAKQVVVDLFRRGRSFATVEFRDALGTSRKYAVPLLDYFDTVRLTVRTANRRTPGAEAKKRLAGEV